MRALVIGTVQFSLKVLERLIEGELEVVGVVTRAHSSSNSDFADLAPLAERSGIPVLHSPDVNAPGTIEWIRGQAPDVIFCVGWSALIGRELLGIPPQGVIGFHPAELPKNRGRHPIIWALALGLERTASTFFMLDEGADSGPIVSQRAVDIDDEDDAASLYAKLTETAMGQIDEFVPLLVRGEVQAVEQDHSKATVWRKRSKEDGRIDFRMPARGIRDLVRALARPYPGAHCVLGGREYAVWRCSVVLDAADHHEPGKVLAIDGKRITVKCGDRAVCLEEHDIDRDPAVNSYFG